MVVSDATELLNADHRKFCIDELRKLPSLRRSKKQDNGSGDAEKVKDSAVLVPICRLPDGAIGLLYTKRDPLLRYLMHLLH